MKTVGEPEVGNVQWEDFKMACHKCHKIIGKYRAFKLPEILYWTCIKCLRKDLEDNNLENL